jgi:hypothetical protein
MPRSDAGMPADKPPPSPPGPDTPARWRLASTVPPHWIPLLPVQLGAADGRVQTRLQRGAVLQIDGPPRVQPARGRVLNPQPGAKLLLHDEEVPREGAHVTRQAQLTRWIGGSTWLWVAQRKQVGRGEGSSGLVFDSAEAEDG